MLKVIRGLSNSKEQPLTSPFSPKPYSIFFELRGGNVVDPMNGKWFEEPFPTFVLRFCTKHAILPFISWRFKNKGGYIGFKAYGASSKEYLNWMPEEDVGEGSYALCFSFRPNATIVK